MGLGLIGKLGCAWMHWLVHGVVPGCVHGGGCLK